MAGNLKHCIKLLDDNEESVRKEAQQLLLRLCKNILQHPEESRYRKIQLANALVSTKLLPTAGAIECLFEAGFTENDDGFLLPISASLTGVKELFTLLTNASQRVNPQTAPHVPLSFNQPSTSAASPCAGEKKYEKKGFLELLTYQFNNVLRYENPDLHNKVKAVLPLELLQVAATKKLREIQREDKIKNTSTDVVYEDLLLSELLSWFKFKFFKWVNSPACQSCTSECTYNRAISSSNPQISRIEIHKCKVCGSENRFPRHTDPEALLYTRKGRCGEWANCFTLVCRTAGFDARLVYDATDHVWTEVWSDAHNRWIHADACENVMDRPMMYEKGWGKKLTYVIAFSRDEIQDVTWRYTRDYDEVMKRRTNCSEKTLLALLKRLNSTRQGKEDYSEARRKFVSKRSAMELAGMLGGPPGCEKPCEVPGNEAVYSGRTSGSLSWRISRGEMGDATHKPSSWSIPKETLSYQLTYFINKDAYTSKDLANDKILETKQKWQNGVESLEGGIFRKEEEDWKVVYLARSPESTTGKITWTFLVEDRANVCVNTVKLQATVATFNGATLKWEIEAIVNSTNAAGEKSRIISIPNCENFETQDLEGAFKIRLSATLLGGKGKTAWQHAQLFRQSLNSNEPSMLVGIELTKRP